MAALQAACSQEHLLCPERRIIAKDQLSRDDAFFAQVMSAPPENLHVKLRSLGSLLLAVDFHSCDLSLGGPGCKKAVPATGGRRNDRRSLDGTVIARLNVTGDSRLAISQDLHDHHLRGEPGRPGIVHVFDSC